MKNNLFIRVLNKETDENGDSIVKTVHLFYAHSVRFGIDEKYSWVRNLILEIVCPDGIERVIESIQSDDEVIIENIIDYSL